MLTVKNLQTHITFCDFLEFRMVSDRNLFLDSNSKFNFPLIRGYSWHKNQIKKGLKRVDTEVTTPKNKEKQKETESKNKMGCLP